MNDSDLPAEVLRVATWNLWWRHGDWESRQPLIIDNLRAIDADVIALQEVASSDPDQPGWLRAELGYAVVTGPDGDADCFSLVNAIASRWPILESSWFYLDVGDMPPHRTLLHAQIDAPTGPVDVYCTHLSHGFDQSALRRRQLRQIAAAIAERRGGRHEGFPPLLLGDLNAVPESDEIRMLTGRTEPAAEGLVFTDAWEQRGAGTGATYSERNGHVRNSAWPERRLDYVLLGWPRRRPLGNPTSVRLFGDEPERGTFASDHFGLVADLVTASEPGDSEKNP